jgi:hypothetical protein
MNWIAHLSMYLVVFLFQTCSIPENAGVRVNQIQVIGSHNSYKQEIEDPLMSITLSRDSNTIGLDYRHIPIKEQLDLGLRGLEIDILHDPHGGKFSKPLGLTLLAENGVNAIPYDTLGELKKGGLKVLHVPDIDFRSHCLTFVNCLQEVREWSQRNPDHLPIIITINPKNSGIGEPGAAKVLPFTSPALDSVDREILSVFSTSELITPDLVQEKFASLQEAVTTAGWPPLESSKGKILFVFDADPLLTSEYIKRGLKGKPMFPNVGKDHPHAGFFIMNDPKDQQQEIQRLVKSGFMVRTRADADTKEARMGDLSRLESAIASGAQLISTDYYLAKLSPSGKFQVTLQNGRYESCNPLIAPVQCKL